MIKSAFNSRRHRNLGFIPLNKWFAGCESHHIDKEQVIHIPEELHKSIWHSLSKNINMDKINKLAFEFLTNNSNNNK